jgi:membrane protein DedA with SNARE-associated domain
VSVLYNYLLSLVRTLAPIIAGWLIVQVAVYLGVHLDGTVLVPLLTSGFGVAYYLVFRWAELHLSRRFGWLLGWATPPQYQDPQG